VLVELPGSLLRREERKGGAAGRVPAGLPAAAAAAGKCETHSTVLTQRRDASSWVDAQVVGLALVCGEQVDLQGKVKYHAFRQPVEAAESAAAAVPSTGSLPRCLGRSRRAAQSWTHLVQRVGNAQLLQRDQRLVACAGKASVDPDAGLAFSSGCCCACKRPGELAAHLWACQPRRGEGPSLFLQASLLMQVAA